MYNNLYIECNACECAAFSSTLACIIRLLMPRSHLYYTTKQKSEQIEKRDKRERENDIPYEILYAILLTSFATNDCIHVKWVNIFNRTLHLATLHARCPCTTTIICKWEEERKIKCCGKYSIGLSFAHNSIVWPFVSVTGASAHVFVIFFSSEMKEKHNQHVVWLSAWERYEYSVYTCHRQRYVYKCSEDSRIWELWIVWVWW